MCNTEKHINIFFRKNNHLVKIVLANGDKNFSMKVKNKILIQQKIIMKKKR